MKSIVQVYYCKSCNFGNEQENELERKISIFMEIKSKDIEKFRKEIKKAGISFFKLEHCP